MIGKKFDGGKSPVTQACLHYFPKALCAVSEVSGYGAAKYEVPFSDKNWTTVPNGYERYSDALGRHLLSEGSEGMYDSESKLMHAAHAAWNALARLELLLNNGFAIAEPIPLSPSDDDIPF